MIDYDIEFFLTVSVFVTGVLLLLRRFLNDPKPKWAFNISASFFPILVIVLCLRSFVIEPFRIPSGSMLPTLEIGDFIVVNKFVYGVRLPILHTLIVENQNPKRGDVVVFRFPTDIRQDYIKRLIGLPGDKIVYSDEDKTLTINGATIPQNDKGLYKVPLTEVYPIDIHRRTEELGNAAYHILVAPDILRKSAEWTVPEGHYFVMGDNRDNSRDSRYWGFVPKEHLIGKAFMIWMSWDYDDMVVRISRLGQWIK